MRTLTITRQNCLSHCSLSPWQSYVRFSDIINDIKRVFTISIFLYLATVQPSVTTNQNAKTYLFFAKALLNVNSVIPGFNIAHSLISWKLPTIGLSLDVQKVVNRPADRRPAGLRTCRHVRNSRWGGGGGGCNWAKSRGGTLVTRTYIKESTYS